MSETRIRSIVPMFGGATNYVETLDRILNYVSSSEPTTDELVDWHRSQFTNVQKRKSIKRRLDYLANVGFLNESDDQWTLGKQGERYFEAQNSEELFDIMTARNVGLQSLLSELADGGQSIEEINDFLLTTHDELNWHPEKTDMAKQRLNWLRSMGFVERRGDDYTLTPEGRQLVDSTSGHSSPGLYLIPVSDYWREKFANSVESPLDLTQYDEVPPQLEGIDELRIWAATETDAPKKQNAIDLMKPGDFLLFYHEGDFFAGGRVGRVFENPDVGQLIWGHYESRHIYTVKSFTSSVISIEKVWDLLGYDGRRVVQGFSRVSNDRVSSLLEDHGSMEETLFEILEDELSPDAIEEERTALEQAVESPPQLTDNEERYTESRRRARDSAFASLVKEAYDYSCAVCGKDRETPQGNPEVEAAHIYPKQKGGSDDVRNGVALCKLHHWAFDSGWISFTDGYEILVKDASDRNGYYEFKQLEGDMLKLPDNDEGYPHPLFLEEHRVLYGFDS